MTTEEDALQCWLAVYCVSDSVSQVK